MSKNPPQKQSQAISIIIERQYIFTPIFFVAAIVLLFLIGIFLWRYILRPQPLADILSVENTAAYAQTSIDPQNPQTNLFLNMTSRYPFLNKRYFIGKLEDFTGMNFEENIKPWFGKSIGIALITDESNSHGAEPVIFAETKSKSEAKKFLQKMAIKFKSDYPQENKYKKFTIYTYRFSQDFAFTFIGYYLVGTENIEAMENFLDTISDDFTAISSIKEYKEANKDYFDLSLAHAYINPQLLMESAMLSYNSSEEQKYLISNLEPIINIFKNLFIRLETKNGYLKLKDTTILKSAFPRNEEKYIAELAEYMPPNIALFYGGLDITRQILSLGRPIKNIIDIQTKSVLGDSISFEKDIFPLLTEEYALGIKENGSVVFAFKAKDPIMTEQKLKTMMIALKRSPLMLKTKIVEVELPNGEKQKESIEAANIVISSETDYRGFKIYGTKTENAEWGIYYTLIDKTVLIGSTENVIKNAIDAFTAKESFMFSDEFKTFIKPLIKNSDEIFYLSADKYFNVLSGISEYLRPVATIAAGRKYDGFNVKTVYYILTK